MKYLFISFFVIIANYGQQFSEETFVITPSMFFEDKLVTEINVNDQNPPSTNFITTVFRLGEKYKIQLYTTEYKYYNNSNFMYYEEQGYCYMNVIYFGEKDLKIRKLKIILEDGSDFDMEVDDTPRTQSIDDGKKYYSVFSFVIPFEVLFEIFNSKVVEFRFRGRNLSEKVFLKKKAKRFLAIFYHTVIAYYSVD